MNGNGRMSRLLTLLLYKSGYFVEYYLRVILKAYCEFTNRLEYIINKKLTVQERVKIIIENNVFNITKKEISEMCFDINECLIERALNQLLKEGIILKISGGRVTTYVIKN